jgi:RNA polymerase sigma-70 factor (ECF subfamily)
VTSPASREEPARADRDLLVAAGRGDADAFETLYERYRSWVVALAYRVCGDRDHALDVLQDAFLHLCRKAPGLRLRGNLKAYLYPVVRHLAIDRIRRRGRVVPLVVEPSVTPRDHAEERRDLEDLVHALPEKQREVVLLRFGDGLKLGEIAEALEVPVGTVKSRLHHALRRLGR